MRSAPSLFQREEQSGPHGATVAHLTPEGGTEVKDDPKYIDAQLQVPLALQGSAAQPRARRKQLRNFENHQCQGPPLQKN